MSKSEGVGDAELRRYEFAPRETIAESKWIKLQTINYKLGSAEKFRKWDVASRTTKQAKSGVADAVTILALLSNGASSSNCLDMEVLLVTQFRPPIEKLSIELPAGLIDKGESAGEAALRELKEETGYTGVLKGVSPILSQSPGMTDETTQVAVVEVDLSLPENQKPEQRLEDTEKIKVTRVKLTNFMDRLASHPDDMVAKGLYFMALGIQLATQRDVGAKNT